MTHDKATTKAKAHLTAALALLETEEREDKHVVAAVRALDKAITTLRKIIPA